MKLICHISIILWLTISSNCQKFSQEQFPFPPQFKPPNSGVFGSDSSIYLPPESHTTMPYFSLNNGNKLPYQFLPPTVTKAPSMYPTPFPMVMSSTMLSHRDEDDDDDEDDEVSKTRIPQITPPTVRINSNQTGKNIEQKQNREMRPIPKTFNFQHPIDRIDIKYPPQFQTNSQKPPVNQSPPSQRRMIISSEILKNDQGIDQVKRASILGPQLISSPVIYYSTTEPAIPILRLSNEMDLDGSFSYEALGADQTHYVQHSRMENTGTDKEEQIVEGSYSYVGDNGQTYTVHYVADSNGYRASGDHLPVPPPIPEIIQRAVQYNLAEEAKKPSHLKSWQDNEKEYDHTESEKPRFSILPPRNLFTGRTPEAFSFGLSQTSILQNNIAAADNSQVPHKTNFDFSTDQANKVKNNNGPIAPQITFLASQGAHNPSINSNQQQISRIFATEKPTLPQIMNYEASQTDPDQENNKALWRWQYGLNANPIIENQHPNKNSISRSSGEGDDVIINFNNMSPEQYTKIIKSDFMEHNTESPMFQKESKHKEILNTESAQIVDNLKTDNSYLDIPNKNENTKLQDDNQHKFKENISLTKEQETSYSTESPIPYNNMMSTDRSIYTENLQYSTDEKEIFTNYNYITPSSLATQSYPGYYDNHYESAKVRAQKKYFSAVTTNTYNDTYTSNKEEKFMINNVRSNGDKLQSDISGSTNDAVLSNDNNIKFTDFIQREENENFKPILKVKLGKEEVQSTTTESTPENIIRENYFLKNLFHTDGKNVITKTDKTEQPQSPVYKKNILEPQLEKTPKYIPHQLKPQNEIKNINKKPLDIADVLNYITLKNHFESNKLKSKNKISNADKYSQRLERPQLFIPIENDRDDEREQLEQEETHNNLRTLNNQKQQELRGLIKNYKVLQRNSNTKNVGQNKDQFLTDASRHHNIMQTQNLPPLGRAGPSLKSYIPPAYP